MLTSVRFLQSLSWFQVYSYMAFIVEKEPSLVVPFKVSRTTQPLTADCYLCQHCQLRQKEVIRLYSAIKRFLFPNHLQLN